MSLTSPTESWSDSVVEPVGLFSTILPCDVYVSTTSRLIVIVAGANTCAGAFHVTLGPLPLNVPTLAAQLNFRLLIEDSASVTSTLTGTSSDASAKFAGSFDLVLCTVNFPITGGVLFTTGPGSMGGVDGFVGVLLLHAVAATASANARRRCFIR